MKVLMLGWELPPHYVGGMGVVCYSLCEHLAKSGADIDFILPFESDYSSIDFMSVNPTYSTTKKSKEINYEHLVKLNANAYGKFDISAEQARKWQTFSVDEINEVYLKKVSQAVLSEQFDVIHAHDWLTMRAGMLAKSLSGIPLIVHVHATEFDRSGAGDNELGNEMIHQIEYEGMMMADTIIAVSQWTKDLICQRYGIDESKIQVVHNSIDLDSPYIKSEIADTENDYKYLEKMQKKGYNIVVNVGRQSIQKGLPGLLETAKLAIEKDPKLIFVLVGSGDMHYELIERAAYLGISRNVIFTGFQNGKRLRDIFELADLFMMPSVSEPFGSTPLEAIGLGTPVLISKQSGVSEVIKTALKADFWDHQAMADMIVSVASNDSLKQELRDNGYREFLSQNWVNSSDKTMGHYRDLVGATA